LWLGEQRRKRQGAAAAGNAPARPGKTAAAAEIIPPKPPASPTGAADAPPSRGNGKSKPGNRPEAPSTDA
jgi:hypothetical protein